MTDVKKICEKCKNCNGQLCDEEDCKGLVLVECDVHGDLKFPRGTPRTCARWEEKAPTLAELREEVWELKEQIRKRGCGEIVRYEYVRECCDDCCKCKRRCNKYSRPYVYPYYEPGTYTPYIWSTTTTPNITIAGGDTSGTLTVSSTPMKTNGVVYNNSYSNK
jgi:hypothetical protein